MGKRDKNNLKVEIQSLSKKIFKADLANFRKLALSLGLKKDELKYIYYDDLNLKGLDFKIATKLERVELLTFLCTFLSLYQFIEPILVNKEFYSERVGKFIVEVN